MAIIILWPAQAGKTSLTQYSWLFLLLISILFGLNEGTLEPLALLPVISFTALVVPFHQTSGVVRLIFASAIVALALALGLHILPGFHNPVVYPMSGLPMTTCPIPCS